MVNYSLLNKKDHNKKIAFCTAEIIVEHIPDLTAEVVSLTSIKFSTTIPSLSSYLDDNIKNLNLNYIIEDIFYHFNTFSVQLLSPITKEDFLYMIINNVKELLFDKYAYKVCLANDSFNAYLSYLDSKSNKKDVIHEEEIHDLVKNNISTFNNTLNQLTAKVTI